MAGKKVWLTWMPGDGEVGPEQVASQLQRYGMQISGAKWEDNLEKVVWSDLAQMLSEEDKVDAWIIAGNKADLDAPRNRYALSMIMATLQSMRSRPLPAFVLGLDFMPDPQSLPALLRSARPLGAKDAGWPAKVIAGSFGKKTEAEEGFRFTVIGHALIGQWYEVGPEDGKWDGVMVGVSSEAKILQHAVGKKGQLPERTVLEYPTDGIKAQLGETEFTACSVRNTIGADESYYVKIDGWPSKIFIGGEPESDEAEVRVLELS